MIALLPAALAATAGSIQVTAGQPGELLLDGFPTGLRAPATLEGVAPGPHTVGMEYGCFVGEVEVEVEREKTLTVALPLEDRGGEGTLQVIGLPRGAELTLDGSPLLDDTSEVGCGPHTLVVEAPGFETWETSFVISTDLLSRVEPELAEAALMDEPMVYNSSDEESFDYDELDDPMLDGEAGEIPDFDISAAERAKKEEEARRRAEAERRRLEEAERQARLAAYGLDEDLDAVEDEDEGGRRKRDRDDEEEDDEPRSLLYGDLDAIEAMVDDTVQVEDGDEDEGFDEHDDEAGIYLGSATYADLDDEDGGRGRDTTEREPTEFPVKWAIVGSAGAVGATGVAVGIVGASRRAEAQQTFDAVVAATNDPNDPAAQIIAENDLNPATRLMTLGFAVGGVGFAAAGGAALAIEVSHGGGFVHVAGRW